jgi:fructan beta-fructosidase
MNTRSYYTILTLSLVACLTFQCQAQKIYHEQYRPQVHFSPREKWTNDPNGMVFNNGVFHLFFQYYPDSTVWGPMHWGHATSTDLVHWNQLPIALYPDSLGYIFSGSAVVDSHNTSGFGKNGKAPMVAIFTQHDPKGEKENRDNFQNQSIAYSLDNGKTWTKFSHNPVLKNPGIKDFRDPKVMWYEPQKKWVMTLATKDRISFYSSPDLKQWKKESEFGKDEGAHGGVWECPDLFTLPYKGKKLWVLIVNLNPGGPNSGSATQYFLGDFDGHKFTPKSTTTKWLDYGPDEYAGITWNNTGNRKIFLGWMSNWLYANVVPTVRWRNAMTIPRELSLKDAGNELYLASQPVAEINKLRSKNVAFQNLHVEGDVDLATKTGSISFPCMLHIRVDKIDDLSISIFNNGGEKLSLGYDKQSNQYYIDRTTAGNSSFSKVFAAKHTAPRFATGQQMDLTLVVDESSVELFADNGLTVMTETFFPEHPYTQMHLQANKGVLLSKFEYSRLLGIWP